MSSTLYWMPTPKPPKGRGGFKLPLKGILAERYLGHDGSLTSGRATLTAADLPFLEGVRAAASKDVAAEVQELMDAIVKYEAIDIFLEG